MSRITSQAKDWERVKYTKTRIIWKNRKKKSVTIQAHYDKRLKVWLVFGALKGVEYLTENPAEVETKKEAISYIALFKKVYKRRGIGALKKWWEFLPM